MDKGLLIKFDNKEQFDKINNLYKELNKQWKVYCRATKNIEVSDLPNPITPENDGWEYMMIKADTCSVDNVIEVGYDAAWEQLKHCVVNGFN